jgi:hypothetical protein
MTKTKIALAAVLFAATSSAAFTQATPASARTLQSAPTHVQQHRNVRLQSAPVLQQRDVALPSESIQGNSAGPFWYGGSGPSSGGM